MNKKIMILLILFSHLLLTAKAAEVDHFTRRNEELEDSSAHLNLLANQDIDASIAILNRGHNGCDEDALYQRLQRYFANHVSGIFIRDVLRSNSFPKRKIKIRDSVYQDWSVFDGAILSLPILTQSGVAISPLIQIGNVAIGTDKFEHMFGEGFSYFIRNYKDKKGALSAIKMGIWGEKTILGGLPLITGVFSYGDLTANFNGMRFWNHILQKNDDALGSQYNEGPYVVCQENHWHRKKMVDFKKYIDDAWDEGINCSKFFSKNALTKFTKRINDLGFSCPIAPEALNQLTVKYGPLSKWLINSNGNEVLKFFNSTDYHQEKL